jgi:putative N-acetyltransferase (TIGR04045 family)
MQRPLVRVATTGADVQEHHRIRHAVFVREQALFPFSDRDDNDRRLDVIRVIGLSGGVAGGAVRLFPLDAERRQWQGDRLAVLPEFRLLGLGKPLVRFATSTAASLGGVEMIAHIQLSNVAFFERLRWVKDGPVEMYVGTAHQPMAIDLTALVQTSSVERNPVTDSVLRLNTVATTSLSRVRT